jgi:hypothetical protein
MMASRAESGIDWGSETATCSQQGGHEGGKGQLRRVYREKQQR